MTCEISGQTVTVITDDNILSDEVRTQVVKAAKRKYGIDAKPDQVKWLGTSEQFEGGVIVQTNKPIPNKSILFG